MHEAAPYPATPLTTGRTLDHAAGVYDLLAPLMMLGMEGRIRRRVIDHLQLSGRERVLDVGCGTGQLTRLIAGQLDGHAGAGIEGIDAAPKMIAVARRKAAAVPNVMFAVVAAENLPYADNSFDRVVSTFFFHHVAYDLKVRSLNEMHRILRPGGFAVIVDVDTPTTGFGRVCAWSGFLLFRQDEIRENIRGRLRQAFDESRFSGGRSLSHHSGYISVFTLVKTDGSKRKER